MKLASTLPAVLALGLASSALAQGNPVVVVETSLGNIEVELFEDKAPLSVKNFLAYANDGFYDGTVFHRVINNFMIQGGGYSADMKKKDTRPPIKNEANNGLKNERGTLAMARTNVVDSATAQFFINVTDNTFLNHRDTSPSGYGYAVFGKVTSGMDVVDKIRAVKTGACGAEAAKDCPQTPVIIKSVKKKAAAASAKPAASTTSPAKAPAAKAPAAKAPAAKAPAPAPKKN